MTHSNNNGMALVIVLWIAVILSSITIAGAYLTRLELRQSYYPLRDTQLLAAAMAAVEMVKEELSQNDFAYDSLKSTWKTKFQNSLQIGTLVTNIQVEDEESKFDVRSLSRERMEKLSIFNTAMNRDEVIDSLIDWQDADSEALPAGAEDHYYLSQDPPRQCKNKPLDCIEELSLVRGFRDPAMIERLKTVATTHAGEKMNINTATVEVLMTLPGVDYLLAQAIIARRYGKDTRQGTADDLPYDTIQSIADVTGSAVFAGIQNLITVKSAHFKVTVTTNHGKYSKIVEALLYRQGKNVRVQYWKEQ